jgi:hypothetical protein
MQLVGLKSVHAGEPLPKGVKDDGAATLMAAYQEIMKPYKGGISFNFSNPTSNKFYREGEALPFFTMVDPTSGEKTLNWTVADFDDADDKDEQGKILKASTMTFYFGTDEPAKGEVYEGTKGFVFETASGKSIAFARLRYSATLAGGINDGDPLQISVSAEVLNPAEGGVAWWPIDTPAFKE